MKNYVHIICPDGIIAFPVDAIGDDARWLDDVGYWISDEETSYWIPLGDSADFGFYAGERFGMSRDRTCECCHGIKPIGQSCICFDNDSQ